MAEEKLTPELLKSLIEEFSPNYVASQNEKTRWLVTYDIWKNSTKFFEEAKKWYNWVKNFG